MYHSNFVHIPTVTFFLNYGQHIFKQNKNTRYKSMAENMMLHHSISSSKTCFNLLSLTSSNQKTFYRSRPLASPRELAFYILSAESKHFYILTDDLNL